MTDNEIYILTGIAIAITLLIVLIVLVSTKKTSTSDEIKGRNQQEILSKIEHLKSEFKAEIDKQNIKSKGDIQNTFNDFRQAVSDKLNVDLKQMNQSVEKRLKEGFLSSDQLFQAMIEKLAIIDTTQKNIEMLSGHVTDLKTYLSDKKSRGMYGELQLYQILNNVFGENNNKLFSKQYKLSNGNIVDALIYGNNERLNIPVDSKFSLENYIKMNDDNISDSEKNKASKLFEQNIKKHVDDIQSKYIINNETTAYALMFIPSEAVFSEIQTNYIHLIQYAQHRKIWITSPTTLVYMLTMILVINQDIDREKNAAKMLEEIHNLLDTFRLFFERWELVKKEVSKLNERIDGLDKPMYRLNNKIYKIKSVDLEDIHLDD